MSALTDGAEDSGARGDELEALAAIFGADFELLPFEMGAVARVAIALESETAKAALEAACTPPSRSCPSSCSWTLRP